MQQIKVYISAKIEHAAKLNALKVDGFHINARWIEMAEAGRKRMKPVTHWQQENFDDIEAAHFFLMYVEPADHLKGSIFEIGHAVRANKLCWIAGNGDSAGAGWGVDFTPEHAANSIRVPHKDVMPWGLYRSRIKMVPSLTQAFKDMRQFVRPATLMNLQGEPTPAPEF